MHGVGEMKLLLSWRLTITKLAIDKIKPSLNDHASSVELYILKWLVYVCNLVYYFHLKSFIPFNILFFLDKNNFFLFWYHGYHFVYLVLRGVHTVVHEPILPRTFVRVRPSQSRTRTKVRVRVRVRRPPTMLDFCTSYTCTTYKCSSLLYSDELIIIAGVSNQNCVLQDIHYKLLY